MAVQGSPSYEETLAAIDSLIASNGDTVLDPTLNWATHFSNTFKHLQVLGLEEAVDRLSVIHVAGTKGKGSTCAFVECMLRAAGFRTGLFTSPHLIDICERFRFNGVEVSRDVFIHNFWWCYKRLEAVKDEVPLPGLFRFMTLLAFRMFTNENVDVAILEVGLGGRLDATNVVRNPVVCGVASLGFDHMDLLGNTLREIAGEKAGIFKAGVPAVTVPQPDEAMEALERKARELEIPLIVAPALDTYGLPDLELGLKGDHQRDNAALGVALCKSWAQRSGNDEHWAPAVETGGIPDSYVRGLADVHWPGRGQIIDDIVVHAQDESEWEERTSGNLRFFLDGAHSQESVDACAKWFLDSVKAEIATCHSVGRTNGQHLADEAQTVQDGDALYRRVLLFNCMPKRDPTSLLPPLVQLCTKEGFPFHAALFSPPLSSQASVIPSNGRSGANGRDLSWQLTVQRSWDALWTSMLKDASGGLRNTIARSTSISKGLHADVEGAELCGSIRYPSGRVMPSLPGALQWIRSYAKRHPQLHIQVLVTGSLYMVGDMLRLLKPSRS